MAGCNRQVNPIPLMLGLSSCFWIGDSILSMRSRTLTLIPSGPVFIPKKLGKSRRAHSVTALITLMAVDLVGVVAQLHWFIFHGAGIAAL